MKTVNNMIQAQNEQSLLDQKSNTCPHCGAEMAPKTVNDEANDEIYCWGVCTNEECGFEDY